MTKQILFNQKHEIDGLFSLPWGDCIGKLNLDVGKVPNLKLILQVAEHNKNELILKDGNKIQFKKSSISEIILDPDYIIKGSTFSYGEILILQPENTYVKTFYGDLIKIYISFYYILSGDIGYLTQTNSSPNFKTAKLFIDGTKKWLDTSGNGDNFAFNNETKEFFNVDTGKFNVKNGYTKQEEAYIKFDFQQEQSIADINKILFQWEIFQSLISGICTKVTKVTLHRETPDQKNTSYLYYFQFPDSAKNFTENDMFFRARFNHCNLGLKYPAYNEIIKKWFARNAEEEYIGNLFYAAILWKRVFFDDKFLCIAKALELSSKSKAINYIKDENEFKNDNNLKTALSKYFENQKDIKKFLEKIVHTEKNNFQDKIKRIIEEDLRKDFLKQIGWEKNSTENQIITFRDACAHYNRSYQNNNINQMQELFSKIKFVLIYIQLKKLGIDEDNIINSIERNNNLKK